MLNRILLIACLLALTLIGVAYAFDIPRFVWGLWKYGGQRQMGTLDVGDSPTELFVYDLATDRQRSLSEWIGGRPLVLVFGSCT